MKNLGWCRASEAFGVRRSGDGQDGSPVGGLGCCRAVVDIGRGAQAGAGMAVFMVVPLGEDVQDASRIGLNVPSGPGNETNANGVKSDWRRVSSSFLRGCWMRQQHLDARVDASRRNRVEVRRS